MGVVSNFANADVARVEVIVHHGMGGGVKGRPDAGNVVNGSLNQTSSRGQQQTRNCTLVYYVCVHTYTHTHYYCCLLQMSNHCPQLKQPTHYPPLALLTWYQASTPPPPPPPPLSPMQSAPLSLLTSQQSTFQGTRCGHAPPGQPTGEPWRPSPCPPCAAATAGSGATQSG